MSINFQAYNFQDVAPLLPEATKTNIETKASKAEIKYLHPEGKASKNWFPILIALGAILALGGVFLSLAAHQVFPRGVNVISNLSPYGQLLGYGTIALGSLIAGIGALKSYHIYKHNSNVDAAMTVVNEVRHDAAKSEMDNYFPKLLKKNEYFVVDDPDKSSLTIYFSKEIKKLHMDGTKIIAEETTLRSHYEGVSYAQTSPEKAFEDWADPHKAHLKKNLTIIRLQKRIKAFDPV